MQICVLKHLQNLGNACKYELSMYSQTCELRPPKGLGICGRISQVMVSFARLGHGSKNLNGVVHHGTHHAPAQTIVIRDRQFQHACGGVNGNDNASGACKRRDDERLSGVPVREKLDDRKVFFAQFDVCGCFSQVDSKLWADLWCSQFAFLRWSHFQERTPYIWIREGTENACPQYSGGRLCQVVARTVRLYTSLYTWRAHGCGCHPGRETRLDCL